jgi:hypothetical protein
VWKKGNLRSPEPEARRFRSSDKHPNHKCWVTVMVTCEPRDEEKGLKPKNCGRIELGLEIEVEGFLTDQDLQKMESDIVLLNQIG